MRKLFEEATSTAVVAELVVAVTAVLVVLEEISLLAVVVLEEIPSIALVPKLFPAILKPAVPVELEKTTIWNQAAQTILFAYVSFHARE